MKIIGFVCREFFYKVLCKKKKCILAFAVHMCDNFNIHDSKCNYFITLKMLFLCQFLQVFSCLCKVTHFDAFLIKW